MKRKIINIVVVLLAAIIIFVSLVLLDSKYNMRHYFDDWKSEIDCDTVSVINDFYDVYDSNGDLLLRMDDVINSGLITTVFCVKGEIVYFSYQTKNTETGCWNIWHIASVSVSGENLKEHYVGNLFDDKIKNPTFLDLSLLSLNQAEAEKYGGLYSNNQIYLHGNVKTVVFDLETETIKECDSLPVCRYTGKVENRQTVTINDTKDGSTHLVTLETMAKDNVYAKELLEISYRRTWSGKVITEDLFSHIKVVDDRVYIICSVYNWNGETFAVEFNYDFSLDKVYYLSSYKVGGIVSGNYAIAPHS